MAPSSPLSSYSTAEGPPIVFYNVIVIHMIVFTLGIHYYPLKKDPDAVTQSRD